MMITKTCYFYNLGVTFDKDDFKTLKDVWNCNGNCCKSDLCNGLSCEDYGINFNYDETIKEIKKYVEDGMVNSYGYIKSVDITLTVEEWNDMYKYLKDNYNFASIKDAKKHGFISFDYGDMLEDYSSYWEEPDKSFLKVDSNTIKENELHILKENELNKETISWINENLYDEKSEIKEL